MSAATAANMAINRIDSSDIKNRVAQTPKRTSTAIDVYVGRRIRMRRNALKLSQAALGEAVGVTFQQIQKYEKGANRVGGQRLHALADALDVPVNFFFEAAPGAKHSPKRVTPDFIDEFLADKRGLELARHFVKITDVTARDALLVVAEVFARRAGVTMERNDVGCAPKAL